MSEFQKNQAAKILSAYSNIFDIIKSHIELEQYHRYGKILFRKRSKRDNSFIYHSTIAADTKNFTKIKEIKQKIAENGYKNEEVEKFINAVITDEFVNKLKKTINNKEAVFITMPSSTGANTIPKMFAEKLGRKLGVEVLNNDFTFSTKANLQAKKQRGIDKLTNQKRYGIKFEFERSLEKYKNKKIYVVDDLFTTGQSVNSFSRMLNDNGFFVQDTISITSASTSFTSNTDINKMVELAVNNLNIPREIAEKKLQILSEYSSTIGKQIYQDLTSKSDKIREKYINWFNSF